MGEIYVDPNSGGAPQPGSYAGAEATEKGFGPPPVNAAGEGVLENDITPASYEAPGFREEVDVPGGKELWPGLGESDGSEVSGDSEMSAVEDHEVETSATTAGHSEDVTPVPLAPGVTLPENAVVGNVGEEADGDDGESAGEEQGEYDELLSGSVGEVNEYLEANPDERDAVLAAEREGKARKGILGDD